MKVLLVEDNQKFARFLVRALTEEGYEVELVGEGEAAVRPAHSVEYDLLILEEALRMARGVAEARRVKLEEPARDSPAWEVEVRGARTDLARALRNLIDNAVTHSPQNAIVHVLAGRFGNKVRFSVIDTGTGVSRADKSNIVHACGGDLTLDVDFRFGAKFDIVLPVYRAHAAFGTAATSSPPPPT